MKKLIKQMVDIDLFIVLLMLAVLLSTTSTVLAEAVAYTSDAHVDPAGHYMDPESQANTAEPGDLEEWSIPNSLADFPPDSVIITLATQVVDGKELSCLFFGYTLDWENYGEINSRCILSAQGMEIDVALSDLGDHLVFDGYSSSMSILNTEEMDPNTWLEPHGEGDVSLLEVVISNVLTEKLEHGIFEVTEGVFLDSETLSSQYRSFAGLLVKHSAISEVSIEYGKLKLVRELIGWLAKKLGRKGSKTVKRTKDIVKKPPVKTIPPVRVLPPNHPVLWMDDAPKEFTDALRLCVENGSRIIVKPPKIIEIPIPGLPGIGILKAAEWYHPVTGEVIKVVVGLPKP